MILNILKKLFIIISIIMCVNDGCLSVCAMAHDRGQLCRVDSLFSLLGGVQGLNLGWLGLWGKCFYSLNSLIGPKILL